MNLTRPFRSIERTRAPLGAVLLTLALLGGGGARALAQDDATPDAEGGSTGTVYTLTNNFTRNEVLAYNRAEDGTLSVGGRFDTEGQGSGS